MKNIQRFKNRKALITGASGGIGKVLVESLRNEGAIVAVTDLDTSKIQADANIDGDLSGNCKANDEDYISLQNSGIEIFRGDTQHTVKEGNNTLDLRLSPLLDDRELTVPRITRINRPFQMEASTSDNITLKVDTVKKEGSSAKDGILSFLN